MPQPEIDKTMIPRPSQSRLAIQLDESAFHVGAWESGAPPGERAFIYRAIRLDHAPAAMAVGPASALTRALEEAVYRNPVLLDDFERVDLVIDAPDFTLLPTELVDEADADAIDVLLEASSAPDTGADTVECRMPRLGASLMMRIPREPLAFMRRTFNNPRLHHPLAVLARSLTESAGAMLPSAPVMHCRLRTGGMLDIVAYSADGLLMANTFAYRDLTDAVYYVMATRQTLGLAPDTGELHLSGVPERRRELSDIMRGYIRHVIAAPLPQPILRAGAEALAAPLSISTLLLCES